MSPAKKRSLDSLGSPEDWIVHAKSDLALATVAQANRTVDILDEQICFHAQQAAEKALKAVLLFNHVDFKLGHDLSYLLDLIETTGTSIPAEIEDVESLTPYAVTFRYPGYTDDETGNVDVSETIAIAGRTIAWAESIVMEPAHGPIP